MFDSQPFHFDNWLWKAIMSRRILSGPGSDYPRRPFLDRPRTPHPLRTIVLFAALAAAAGVLLNYLKGEL